MTQPFHRMFFAALGILFLLSETVPGQRSASVLTPDRIFEAANVREGSTVCEIGAGNGDLSIAAARVVGPAGRVYTSELGENRIRKLADKVQASGIAHITVLNGDTVKTNFPNRACDSIVMRDVYHHFAEPVAMNRSIAAALKPAGRLVVIDFTPPNQEAARPADRARNGTHGVLPATVLRELREAGFETVSSEPPIDRWFMAVLSRRQ